MKGKANYCSGRSLDCDLGLYAHGIFGRRQMKKASQSTETKHTVPTVSPRAYAEFEILSTSDPVELEAMEDNSLWSTQSGQWIKRELRYTCSA